MSKDDKKAGDKLSHLGPPAMARRFSQVSPRDEIAKFEKVPVSELGKARFSTNMVGPDAVALVEARARIKELEALLGARDEALAAALELAQSRVVPAVPAPVPASTLAGTPTVPGKRTDRSVYLRQAKRDARAAKKLGMSVTDYKAQRDAKG